MLKRVTTSEFLSRCDERIKAIPEDVLQDAVVQGALGSATKILMLLDVEKGHDRIDDRLALLRNYSEVVLYSPGLLAITQGELVDRAAFQESRADLWASPCWWNFDKAAANNS